MKRVTIIGDRNSHEAVALVAARLRGRAEIWNPDRVVGSVLALAENLQDWVLRRQADVVHIGGGLLDTRKFCFGADGTCLPISHYREHVDRLFAMMRERTASTIIWSTITPVDTRRMPTLDDENPEFLYDNKVIARFNEAARELAEVHGILLDDLYGLMKAASRDDSHRPDGIAYCQKAKELMADKIATAIESVL